MSDGKTQIGSDQSSLATKAKAEEERADNAVRELGKVQNRIRKFYSEVSCVHFDEETAPVWAEKWLDFLLAGTVPATVVVETAEEAALLDAAIGDEVVSEGVADKAEFDREEAEVETVIENDVEIPADTAG